MRPLRLFRTADDRPALKDRLAALKARLGRVAHRPDGGTDTQRRSMLAGSLVAALPIPAFAVAANGRHPDQAVFEAAARMRATEAANYAARRTHSAAIDAVWSDIGICPPELISHWWCGEIDALETSLAPREVRCVRVFQWVRGHQEDDLCNSKAWTAPGLHIAIKHAVPIFGRAGQTPLRIRRWRALIPAAEAFDAMRARAEARHHVTAAEKASREASAAWTAAQCEFDRTAATTIAGLALVASRVGRCSPERMSPHWRNLLASAVNVAGVDLAATDR